LPADRQVSAGEPEPAGIDIFRLLNIGRKNMETRLFIQIISVKKYKQRRMI
jgi:hypothetical protein